MKQAVHWLRLDPLIQRILSLSANGSIVADKIVLPSTPAVLSVGQSCLEKGYDFVWRQNNAPYFVRSDGKVALMKLDGRVPHVDDECEVIASEPAMPVAQKSLRPQAGTSAECCIVATTSWDDDGPPEPERDEAVEVAEVPEEKESGSRRPKDANA